MKILFVTPGCFDKGGISRYNRYQIQLLKEHFGETNIRVLSLLGPDENSFEEHIDVKWHGSKANVKSKIRLIYHLLRNAFWKPDIIWIGHVNLSGICFITSFLCSATTVLNVYGLEIWSNMRRDAYWGLKNVNFIVSDCHNTASYLTANQIRLENDIEVIWDCIDIARFTPGSTFTAEVLNKYNIPDPNVFFNILSLGRLSKPDALYKGYDRLLEAFSKISGKYSNIRLVFAGRGNFTEDLKKLADKNGTADKIYFTGSVAEDDLVTVYQSCAIFSLITQSGKGKGEGIPLTPLEAMACGKPILVGDEDGSREAVFENRNGKILSPTDIEAHANAMCEYIENEEYLKEQSIEAVKIARSVFSYKIFKEKHLRFIQKKILSIEK